MIFFFPLTAQSADSTQPCRPDCAPPEVWALTYNTNSDITSFQWWLCCLFHAKTSIKQFKLNFLCKVWEETWFWRTLENYSEKQTAFLIDFFVSLSVKQNFEFWVILPSCVGPNMKVVTHSHLSESFKPCLTGISETIPSAGQSLFRSKHLYKEMQEQMFVSFYCLCA